MARSRSRRSRSRSRKMNRRAKRRGSRRQRGGQAPVNDTSMNSASNMSHAQGKEYANIHANQHGGAAVSLAAAAPVGYTGMLDDSLRATARIGPIDASMAEIQGMSDQSGGGRRRRGRASRVRGAIKGAMRNFRYGFMHPVRTTRRVGRNVTRALKRALKFRGSRRRGMRGGAGSSIGPMADYASPGMLLSPAQEARALMGMNPEWRLAADPKAFAP